VKLITQQNADYLITLKNNQGNLYDEVEKLFNVGMSTSFDTTSSPANRYISFARNKCLRKNPQNNNDNLAKGSRNTSEALKTRYTSYLRHEL